MKLIRDWFHETFSDRQVLILTVILLVALAGIMFIADMMAPVIAAIIIAFMLDGPVQWMTRKGMSHIVAVNIAFITFFLAALLFLLGLLPVLFRQMGQFVAQVPDMTQVLQNHLLALPKRYPEMISEEQINSFIGEIGSAIVSTVSTLPSFAGASVVGLLTAIVYLILVMLLVFVMVKDKKKITTWLVTFLPRDRDLTSAVWSRNHDTGLQLHAWKGLGDPHRRRRVLCRVCPAGTGFRHTARRDHRHFRADTLCRRGRGDGACCRRRLPAVRHDVGPGLYCNRLRHHPGH